MSKFKRSLHQPKPSSPPKPRYTSSANLYHKEVIAPLERKLRHAFKKKNYDEASSLFQTLLLKRQHHRTLIKRNDKVIIRNA